MDQLLSYLTKTEKASTNKIKVFLEYIYDEHYDSDSIQMDMNDTSKGNIENTIDDAAIVKSIKNFIELHSSFVLQTIHTLYNILYFVICISDHILFL